MENAYSICSPPVCTLVGELSNCYDYFLSVFLVYLLKYLKSISNSSNLIFQRFFARCIITYHTAQPNIYLLNSKIRRVTFWVKNMIDLWHSECCPDYKTVLNCSNKILLFFNSIFWDCDEETVKNICMLYFCSYNFRYYYIYKFLSILADAFVFLLSNVLSYFSVYFSYSHIFSYFLK